MKCLICKEGETKPGKATVTFQGESLTLVIKDVPAQVCANCGEVYVDERVVEELLETAEETARSDAEVDVPRYKAA